MVKTPKIFLRAPSIDTSVGKTKAFKPRLVFAQMKWRRSCFDIYIIILA